MENATAVVHREPWNKGKIVGQKAPFKPKDIWALRVRLQMDNRVRELALFNLGMNTAGGCRPAKLTFQATSCRHGRMFSIMNTSSGLRAV